MGKRCIQAFGGETGEKGATWKPYGSWGNSIKIDLNLMGGHVLDLCG
jgi:hypothetical protein